VTPQRLFVFLGFFLLLAAGGMVRCTASRPPEAPNGSGEISGVEQGPWAKTRWLRREGRSRAALQLVEASLRRGDNNQEGLLLQAELLMELKPRNWRERAARVLARVTEDGFREKALLLRGDLEFTVGDFQQALNYYSRVLRAPGSLAEEAAERLQRAQRLVRLHPRTDTGIRLAQREQLTRADLAELLITEVELPALDTKNVDIPRDVRNLPRQEIIHEALAGGLLRVDAEGLFHPTQPVTRGMLAQVLRRLSLMVPGVSTDYAAAPRYDDLLGLNREEAEAVAFCSAHGLIQGEDLAAGVFGFDTVLSGGEILAALRSWERRILRHGKAENRK